MKAQVEKIFPKCDVDGDGLIDRKELKAAILRDDECNLLPPGLGGDTIESQVNAIFEFMDASGDGKLSKEEIFGFCDAFVDSLFAS